MNDERKKVWVLSAFGDISGFGAFWSRVTNEDSQLNPFLDTFDSIVAKVKRENDFYFKDLGDGFFTVLELDGKNDSEKTVRFISCLFNLLQKIKKEIRKMDYPKPDGFRIRVAHGYATKKNNDYRGRYINFSAKLIPIKKRVCFIIHESVCHLFKKGALKKSGFSLKKLQTDDIHIEETYRRDVDAGLWALIKKK